ncbi:hypothetical protein [Mesorhizobium sp.]|nr:hypothetical protein [Mesorhizobium sp.]
MTGKPIPAQLAGDGFRPELRFLLELLAKIEVLLRHLRVREIYGAVN